MFRNSKFIGTGALTGFVILTLAVVIATVALTVLSFLAPPIVAAVIGLSISLFSMAGLSTTLGLVTSAFTALTLFVGVGAGIGALKKRPIENVAEKQDSFRSTNAKLFSETPPPLPRTSWISPAIEKQNPCSSLCALVSSIFHCGRTNKSTSPTLPTEFNKTDSGNDYTTPYKY